MLMCDNLEEFKFPRFDKSKVQRMQRRSSFLNHCNNCGEEEVGTIFLNLINRLFIQTDDSALGSLEKFQEEARIIVSNYSALMEISLHFSAGPW